MKRIMRHYQLIVLVAAMTALLGGPVSQTSCAKAPPNLTPAASMAFRATQVVRALDVLRDVAIDANAQKPPLLSEEVTRKVVLYHQSTVKVIQATPAGWPAMTKAGLDALLSGLAPPERALLAPYAGLINTIIQEVGR